MTNWGMMEYMFAVIAVIALAYASWCMKEINQLKARVRALEPAPELSPEHLAEIRSLLARDKKIEAIKRAREITGMGLRDAKEFVEGLAR